MLEHLMAWPSLIKVFACFFAVVGVNRLGLNLGFALGGAGVLLGLWSGLPMLRTLELLAQGVTSGRTLTLAAIVVLILGLSHMLKESGKLTRLVEAFQSVVHSPKVVAATMPAIIGLLPMPGGALFSAPMVEASCRWTPKEQSKAGLMVGINYWFRHHGEYWWPLYPGVILSVSLLGMSTWLFVVVMLPMVLVHFAAGVWFLLRNYQAPEPETASQDSRAGLGALFTELLPILIVVASIPIISAAVAGLGAFGVRLDLPSGSPLLAGLAAACLQVAWSGGLKLKDAVRAFAAKDTLSMLALVLGIMAFQELMQGSGAVTGIQKELVSYGIPLLAMVAVMPFISGLITGIAIGYVGASFPLVVPLFSGLSGGDFLAHAVLAHVAGFIGMMLSPVHLCFLVTKDYFKSSLSSGYANIGRPLAAVAAALAVWCLLLSMM